MRERGLQTILPVNKIHDYFSMKNTSKGERFVKIVILPEKKRGEYGKNPTNQFLMSNVELGIRSIQVSHFLRSFPQNRMS